MRKIEQQMCLAAGQHRKWKSGNTEVYPADGGFSEVYLHGNHIATVNTSNGLVSTSDSTTKNTLCSTVSLDRLTVPCL